MVFVIDSSGYDSNSFQLIKEFTASNIAELFHNSPGSAVAVILFHSVATIQFNLQAYTSLNSLLSAINRLPYHGGGADTAEALTLLLASAQNGTLGLRSDSSKLAIVITQSLSQYRSATLLAAEKLHASNIFDVFAVGKLGNVRAYTTYSYMRELLSIASGPGFIFFTSSFTSTDVQQLQGRITPQLCNGKLPVTVSISTKITKMYSNLNCDIYFYPLYIICCKATNRS